MKERREVKVVSYKKVTIASEREIGSVKDGGEGRFGNFEKECIFVYGKGRNGRSNKKK